MPIDLADCDRPFYEFLQIVQICRIANQWESSVTDRLDGDIKELLRHYTADPNIELLEFHIDAFFRDDSRPVIIGGVLNAIAEAYATYLRYADHGGELQLIRKLEKYCTRFEAGNSRTQLREWPLWLSVLIACRDQSAMKIGLDQSGLFISRSTVNVNPVTASADLGYEKRLETLTSLCIKKPEVNESQLQELYRALGANIRSSSEPNDIRLWSRNALTAIQDS